MTSMERYSVGSDDGRSISFQKEEDVFLGIDVTVQFKHVVAVVVFVAALVSGVYYYDNMHSNQAISEVQMTITQSTIADPIDSDGFVFAKSSKENLSKETVLKLLDEETIGFQRLLRMSINEIYARHGQVFNAGEENDAYYQHYNWYRETDKHIVEWDEFNDTEKANLRLLISIEEEYDYR